MTNRWTKLITAAAAIAIAVTLSVLVVRHSATPAYAIEQTIEANRTLRYIHIKIEPSGMGLGEAWAQLGEQGELLHLRMNFPNTEDGAKEVLWQADKADVWFKSKNGYVTVSTKRELEQLPRMLDMFDPKRVVEALYDAQAKGRVTLDTKMPSRRGEPITLTATSLPTGEQREVYSIDPASKLLQRFEKFVLVGDQYVFESRWDYLEYNQMPDPAVFVLNPPADVMRVDETAQVIGLPKGNLSDGEITVQVAREFFEALIARDYAKAGQLYSGVPAAEMQKLFGAMKFLRIVSIGEPKPHSIPGVGGMVVPCQVEIEMNGTRLVHQFNPAVRPVYSQPERWAIHGGV